jgi:ParB family chromosome partitioning protein
VTLSSETKTIPLNRLVVSAANVRKTDRKADVAALAASIQSHGLLQNLAVTESADGKFAVVAGARRLAALKMLAKSGAVAKDYPVLCKVVASEAGAEASLVENVHRVAMDVMDEVSAFATLHREGNSADEIARRFGATRRHVEQRLALANLSPKIKAAWKRGDINLDAARAFCLLDDHARQDAVFRSLGKPVTHAASVRARLMEGRMRASDRLALFVGIAAYEAAGGSVIRDLFDEDAVFVEDPALMLQLAEDKLQERRAALVAEGWSWTEVSLGTGRIEGASATRIQPDWREPTEEEAAEIERLKAELDALDAALDQDSVEDDPRWDQRDDLAGAIEAIRQSARVWNVELMAHAGVVLSLEHDGGVHETAGIVRHCDEKAVRAIRQPRSVTGEASGEDACGRAEPTADSESGLPKSLIRDLSAVRTRALRLAIMKDARLALSIAVAAMASRTFLRADLSGVAVAATPAHVDDFEETLALKGTVESSLPIEETGLLGWCLAQTSDTLLSVLAILVGGAVDLTHERGTPADRRRQDVADTLASAAYLDMGTVWTCDIDYWTRLPKAELIAALRDAPDMIERSPQERDAQLKAHGKLKKDDLAATVARAFEGTGYLPELLVTSLGTGEVELTDEGLATAA